MRGKSVPWQEVRRRYEQGEKCAALAREYGVSVSTVSRRARAEQWGGEATLAASRESMRRALRQLEQSAEVLLQRVQSEDAANAREIKDLAALLRDLAALEKSLGEDAPALIRVVLSEPLEDWAQ